MEDQRLLRVEIDSLAGVAVVKAHGEVDLTTAPDLAEAIDKAMASAPTILVVDLSGVGFLASVGMSALIKARREMGSATTMALVADGPATRRPMELVGLDAAIPLYSDLASALASVGGAASVLPLPTARMDRDTDENDAEEGIA
ncbi:MAG: STAS domain-containing protein [Rhodococcus sp. (in: high G+C Gram-positive bacteria)]